MAQQPNNPLHGLTLQTIVEQLLAHYGWEALADRINIRCFKDNPSVTSTVSLMDEANWARKKVEDLYARTFR